MRLPTILAIVFASSVGAFAEQPTTPAPNCLSRLAQQARAGYPITVLTNDSTLIAGSRPMISSDASILLLRVPTDRGVESSQSIPLDRISRISYCRPSPAREVLTLIGLTVGTVGGVLVAAAVEGETVGSRKSWGWDALGTAFFGGLVGGVAGAVAGHAIGKHITVTVTLECL
ncbi:MAG: hypothetical protein ABIE70_09260 [bacterium]